MKKLMAVASILVLLCAACSSDKEKSNAHQKDESTKTESKQKDNSKNESKANENKPKQAKNVKTDVNDVSNKTKLALAFFADEDGKYIVTKDEVLQGIYEQNVQGEKENKKLYKLLLIDDNHIKNAPDDMKFYSVYPAKGSFSTVVGLSKDKLYVGGTQGAMTYKELLETGKEYNLQDLYDKNKNYTSLEELANKIEFKKEHPFIDDETRKEFELQESPGTEAHLRSQVYGMISDFEGEPIGDSKYTVDIVRHDNNGKWYVNYRNEHGEIIGTYTTKGEDIVKKDAEGNIIEQKHVENRYQ
ncbi:MULTISPECIES: hypothetical protein [Mammaliicoccus]|uniref:Lipoprotein n=1 Tax=Mammaliicoccus sciuri TaxID=1296 RepID=A0AAW5LL36_MAMSC|nr:MULTISPECIES: hypothetical protein [Mammaliicoccus]MCD5140024.1 hypothetical protein [Mammaliicoccus sciuri]MCQ9303466.1 hypothetical protein [Mammaliicoccus sciuri]MDO0957330.1 hypothetical protein [Mammaliicoccus sciuri]